jgi:hypothetical protein
MTTVPQVVPSSSVASTLANSSASSSQLTSLPLDLMAFRVSWNSPSPCTESLRQSGEMMFSYSGCGSYERDHGFRNEDPQAFSTLSLSLTHTLSLSHTHSLSLTHTLSLSHTHTLSLTHTHSLSLSRPFLSQL